MTVKCAIYYPVQRHWGLYLSLPARGCPRFPEARMLVGVGGGEHLHTAVIEQPSRYTAANLEHRRDRWQDDHFSTSLITGAPTEK
jgi:hypothetical protein